MKTIITALFTLGMVSSYSAQAKEASEILAEMDSNMNQAGDQILDWKVTSMEPGKKSAREMAFSVQLKDVRTLTEFSAPGDIKGTRVLVLNRTQMYIYLPAYRKVRRIASHMTQQGFMGTTYSHADMSANRFGDIYTGTLKAETETEWEISLTAIEGKDAPYPTAEITVIKEKVLPSTLKYFNDKGEHIKTETRGEYECREGVCNPTVLKMVDHSRKDAWTELRCTEWKANTGLTEDIFSVRNLQRGG